MTAERAVKPKFQLMSHAQRVKTFGAPATIVGGGLMPDVNWERANIETIPITWGSSTKKIRVHKKAADCITLFFGDVAAAKLGHLLLSFNGAHVTRMKRGKEKSLDLRDLSTHAFGAAFDINAVWNPLGKTPPAASEKGTVRPLLEFAERRGLIWGGGFTKPDGMHFEVGV